jgi:hypothetical protein
MPTCSHSTKGWISPHLKNNKENVLDPCQRSSATYIMQNTAFIITWINLQFTELHAYIFTHRITERTVSSNMK